MNVIDLAAVRTVSDLNQHLRPDAAERVAEIAKAHALTDAQTDALKPFSLKVGEDGRVALPWRTNARTKDALRAKGYVSDRTLALTGDGLAVAQAFCHALYGIGVHAYSDARQRIRRYEAERVAQEQIAAEEVRDAIAERLELPADALRIDRVGSLRIGVVTLALALGLNDEVAAAEKRAVERTEERFAREAAR